MASTTISVLTKTMLGAVITAKTGVGTGESITISPTTAQGAIDWDSVTIRVSAVGGSVTPTIAVGSGFSSIGQSTQALTAIASSTTAVIGGQGLESARFLNASGNLVIGFVGTGTASIEVYQSPRATE